MQRRKHQLDYHVDATHRGRNRFALCVGLLIVSVLLFVLRGLETMPYRPPSDMSPALGGGEAAIVRAVMVVFAAIWCALLIGLVISFRSPRSR